MPTNFDFLTSTPSFSTFAPVAVSAEKLLYIDRDACVLNCRRAMEFAVKWMYSVDRALELPYQTNLDSLMKDSAFLVLVGKDVSLRMDYVRNLGNTAAHGGKPISEEQTVLCLENLFVFFDFVAHHYAPDNTVRAYDRSLLVPPTESVPRAFPDVDVAALMEENKALREELTARRAEQQQTYTPKPLDLSEYETRRLYIDVMLTDAGWVEGRDWLNEVEVRGMPSPSGIGYADYVLYGDDGRPLAVLEAKSTCTDVGQGRHQAKLYADALERQYGRRPIIFLSNGFDTRIFNDRYYPERRVASVYSKRDLEKLFNLLSMRTSLKDVTVNAEIAGRYYQEGAIKAVCECLDTKNRRKALLVMATGSGKTRTVIALCDVLLRHGWVKNILFLADRTVLVRQAKKEFVKMLPDLSVTNLCEDKENYDARCVFSTYQTMMNCIDAVRDEDNRRLYTVGHFDLVIVDEAHRSIYNKYKDIFTYFDAPLVGLTATPKDEIDKNTYEIFDLENGVPTYGYELAQAVHDGFLVDFMSVETKLKFIENGIVYDELSDEEKEEYEKKFLDENGDLPDSIASSALNEWVFNEDTIRQVLHILMRDGLRIDYGERLGKTIIFAKNHAHAEKIHEIFGKEYPHLPGYTKVIDNYMTYAQSAIADFSDPQKLPQIAISVDMLDTGVDVPEVLNLVFFKKVMSKAKFWQMIGRGTRRCDGLMDGGDKDKFYIFDFCGNFEFFRVSAGNASANQIALQGALFRLKAQIAFTLQDTAYQTPELMTFRQTLVDDMVHKVRELNRDNFAVHQHLRNVERYSDPANYAVLTYENTLQMAEELAPLLTPDVDDMNAVRFDALIYGMELAYLAGKSYSRAKTDLVNRVRGLAAIADNIPAIKAQNGLFDQILHTGYLEHAGVGDFEYIRECLRDLMKYLPQEKRNSYQTNFTDDILSVEWHKSELENDDLKNYRAKVEYYIRQHQNEDVIAKLHDNVPLMQDDIQALEKVLWNDLGSRNDYEAEYGEKPLGEFVRGIVGLDMRAAKEAFSAYLSDVNLDSKQIYFVNQIVEYIVQNGMMKDLSVLQESPFTDQGSIVEVFTDLSVWFGIKSSH
ncbi:MAG: DEAD/DEAH box helicase family protein [Clostridia bacterium]|nr:DEAD/DEAH box helicase family protein [Clostridia bacterium]